ncbi:hypothetical protein HPP92_023237 [Vanilla planifolia]|uniref:Uncharacterized protein n=1 Tax=Vanilla planifolia TaxID=51239 RepID=A0A835UEE4_VANPL|nr:hypothetical protein HPP92_023237 [Vanilla planifolia]
MPRRINSSLSLQRIQVTQVSATVKRFTAGGIDDVIMDHTTATYTHIVIAPPWQTIASSPKRVTSSPRHYILAISSSLSPQIRRPVTRKTDGVVDQRRTVTADGEPSSPSSSSSGVRRRSAVAGCLWTAVEETPPVIVGAAGVLHGPVVKRLLQGLGESGDVGDRRGRRGGGHEGGT